MSNADILKWDNKYRHSEAVVTIEAEPELLEYSSVLPRSGKALDLACGLGKNSLYLAQRGFDVTAMDGSALGLEKLRASARAHGLAQGIKTQQVDLDQYPLAEACFDFILVVRYLNRALLVGIASALKPGGVVMYKTFNHNILKQRPGFNPAYTIETPALMEAFRTLEVVADNHGDTKSEYAFMIARKGA